VVGDFEDAAYCWRVQANNWPDKLLGMVLASGAGAMGVKLVDALPLHGVLQARPDIGLGDEADADYVQAAIGLVWRVLLLMVGLLILLTFAHWLGA
jgi:adenosylcobinamide-phosphate synthase